ncbi:MAG: hypothetical protein ACK5Q5_15150 [Planctomycetaceae bacterium]
MKPADLTKPADLDIDDTPQAQQASRALWRKMEAASAQPGFSGELRRAIDAARIPSHRLAADCDMDVETLEAFRCGEAELPTGVVDRLVAALGLTLQPSTIWPDAA